MPDDRPTYTFDVWIGGQLMQYTVNIRAPTLPGALSVLFRGNFERVGTGPVYPAYCVDCGTVAYGYDIRLQLRLRDPNHPEPAPVHPFEAIPIYPRNTNPWRS